MPERVQLRRTKGWRMPPNTVKVARPSLWGNPIKVNEKCTATEAVRAYRQLLTKSQMWIAQRIKSEDGHADPFASLNIIAWREKVKRSLPELRGKNLACFCPLDQPCHADVLLKLANR